MCQMNQNAISSSPMSIFERSFVYRAASHFPSHGGTKRQLSRRSMCQLSVRNSICCWKSADRTQIRELVHAASVASTCPEAELGWLCGIRSTSLFGSGLCCKLFYGPIFHLLFRATRDCFRHQSLELSLTVCFVARADNAQRVPTVTDDSWEKEANCRWPLFAEKLISSLQFGHAPCL